MKITVFGDSILKGVVTNPGSDKIFEITENDSLSLAQKVLGFELDNRSIYGNIISKAQVKFNKWIEKGETSDICIIEFGGNDCDYDWAPISENPDGEYQQKTPLDDYLRIHEQMVNVCKDHNITPVIMTMPPLVHERWLETVSKGMNKENVLKFIGGNSDKLYRNHEIYNAKLTEFAYTHGVKLVDMRTAMLQTPNYRDYMCMDGIHPNEAGYEVLSKVWIKEIPTILK